MALFIAVPLIVTGVAIAPRTSRVSELAEFHHGLEPGPQDATPTPAVPIRVEALTRSCLADDDLQPTSVTATITPPNDTEYQARWITSMSRSGFQSLTTSPVTALAPDRLPPRETGRTPGFDDQPGRWAVIYPVLTALVALTVLFSVGDAWHVSTTSASAPVASHADTAPTSKNMNLNARRDGMIRAITEQFGPAAANNLLGLRFTGSGSDYGTVLRPDQR